MERAALGEGRPSQISPFRCATVRVLGERMQTHFYEKLARAPRATAAQVRTVSSWGDKVQADLTRLRIGLVGAGSVGGVIAEGLARTGFQNVVALDFDRVEERNLDRLAYATRKDIGRFKVDALAEHLHGSATAENFDIETLRAAIYEEVGFRAALDCDILLSCVDRPWGRYVLNLLAYAHLIPVIDGGIAVRTNRHGHLAAADWRAHTATPTRRCLQCLGQYDPGLVQLEREGFLDDPKYIAGLPEGHHLKTRENVYAFALSCGSLQLLQLLTYVVAPLGLSNPGAQRYRFVGAEFAQPDFRGCDDNCAFPPLIAMGDDCGIAATGNHSPRLQRELKKEPPPIASWWARGRAKLLELVRRPS